MSVLSTQKIKSWKLLKTDRRCWNFTTVNSINIILCLENTHFNNVL